MPACGCGLLLSAADTLPTVRMSATKVNMMRRSRYSLHTLSGKVLVLISYGVRAYADIVMAAMAIIAKLSSRGALVR